jgi:hypothetical protein
MLYFRANPKQPSKPKHLCRPPHRHPHSPSNSKPIEEPVGSSNLSSQLDRSCKVQLTSSSVPCKLPVGNFSRSTFYQPLNQLNWLKFDTFQDDSGPRERALVSSSSPFSAYSRAIPKPLQQPCPDHRLLLPLTDTFHYTPLSSLHCPSYSYCSALSRHPLVRLDAFLVLT